MLQIVTNIVFENQDLVIANKPSNIPSAPLKSSTGPSFLKEVATLYPEIMSVKGFNEWEGGLLHRLDTPTSGLVLFARNQRAFDALYAQQKKDLIIKQYRAIYTRTIHLEGFPTYPFSSPVDEPVLIHSSFRPYGKKGSAVRPLLTGTKDLPVYCTDIVPEKEGSVICTIRRGFRHQIRCHMAWAGYPLVGDTLYGGEVSENFGLSAIGISFINPSDGKTLSITLS